MDQVQPQCGSAVVAPARSGADQPSMAARRECRPDRDHDRRNRRALFGTDDGHRSWRRDPYSGSGLAELRGDRASRRRHAGPFCTDRRARLPARSGRDRASSDAANQGASHQHAGQSYGSGILLRADGRHFGNRPRQWDLSGQRRDLRRHRVRGRACLRRGIHSCGSPLRRFRLLQDLCHDRVAYRVAGLSTWTSRRSPPGCRSR